MMGYYGNMAIFIMLLVGITAATAAGNVSCAAGGTLLDVANANYTMNASATINGSNCFNVTADNVTLNCGGVSITGNNTISSYGIVTSKANTVIRNCGVYNFYNGIRTTGTNTAIHASIVNVTASGATAVFSNGADTLINMSAISSQQYFAANLWTGSIMVNSNVTGTKSGVHLNTGSGMTIANNIINTTGVSYGGVLMTTLTGSTIANNTISSPVAAVETYSGFASTGNTFYNNTIISSSGSTVLLSMNSVSTGNTFYWNRFMPTTALYVSDGSAGNYYNTTEGNIWPNILNGSITIGGNNNSAYGSGWRIGSYGNGYPYNNSTSQNKVSAGVIDYAPVYYAPVLQCGVLSTANATYLMNGSVTINGSTCFTINATSVTLDCNGYSVTGNNSSGTYGVYSNQANTTVKNCIIQNFSEGILYSAATDGLIQNNTITITFGNGNATHITSSSHRNTLNQNTITTGNASGIYIDGGQNTSVDCGGSSIAGINISSTYGIYSSQYNTTIRNCAAADFGYGVYFATGATFSALDNFTYSGGTSAYNAIYPASTNGTFTNLFGSHKDSYYAYVIAANNTFRNVGISGVGFRIAGASTVNTYIYNLSVTATGASTSYAVYHDNGNTTTIDCAGGSLIGNNATNSWGIYTSRSYTTIKNCIISNYSSGIHLAGGTGTIVANNTASSTFTAGGNNGRALIVSAATTSAIVANNTFSSTHRPLASYGLSSSNVTGNVVTATSGNAITIDSGNNNMVANNTASSPSYAFEANIAMNTTFINNTAAGSTSGYTVTTAPNTLIDCGGIAMIGKNSSSSYGVYSTTSNTTVKNCNISNFNDGIRYSGSTDGLIQNNTIAITYSGGKAIYLTSGSNRNNLTQNTISNVNASGIYIDGGHNATVDCAGRLISGTNGTSNFGVYIAQDNIALKDCNVYGFTSTIYLSIGTNISLSNVNATSVYPSSAPLSFTGGASGTASGVLLNATSTANTNALSISTAGVTISNSTIISAAGGISFSGAANILIENTSVTSGTSGAIVNGASGSNITMDCMGKSITGNGTGSNVAGFNGNIANSTGATVKNCVISNFSTAAIRQTGSNGTFINNTLLSSNSAGILVTGSNNTFYWNNITAIPGLYVNDTNGSNYYNSTAPGLNEGNIWWNVQNGSVAIYGHANSSIAGLYIGSTGAGYPYSNSSSTGKLICNFDGCADYAPLTPFYDGGIHANLSVTCGAYGAECTGNATNVSIPANMGINATAIAGYSFANWTVISGNCTVQNNTTSATTAIMTDGSSCVVQANFMQNRADLAVLAGANGLAVGNATAFLVPDSKPINATADIGFYFANWSIIAGTCTIGDNALANTLAVFNSTTLNCTVQANFLQRRANLSANSGSNGNAAGNSTDFLVPANKTITANPDTGYTFSSWVVVSGNCTINNSAINNTTAIFERTTSNCVVRADFTQNTANLTVLAGAHGSASGNATAFLIPSSKAINATADIGYYFANWSIIAGTCTIANDMSQSTTAVFNSTTLSCTVQANFAQNRANLTVLAAENGTALGNASNFLVPANKSINATATVRHYFASWSTLSGGCAANSTSSNVTYVLFNSTAASCTVQANFGTYGNLSVIATAGGRASGNNTTFIPPVSLRINATALVGYYFNGWVASGSCAAFNNSSDTLAVIPDTTPCIMEAQFGQYGNLSVLASAGGSAIGNNSTFIAPANMPINATPAPAYGLANWSVVSGSCTVAANMTANTTVYVPNTTLCQVQANFAKLGTLTVNYTVGGNASGSNTTFIPPATLPITAAYFGGYAFGNWTTDCNGTIANASQRNTTITIYNHTACYAQASFVKLVYITITSIAMEPVPMVFNTSASCHIALDNNNTNITSTLYYEVYRNFRLIGYGSISPIALFDYYVVPISSSDVFIGDIYKCRAYIDFGGATGPWAASASNVVVDPSGDTPEIYPLPTLIMLWWAQFGYIFGSIVAFGAAYKAWRQLSAALFTTGVLMLASYGYYLMNDPLTAALYGQTMLIIGVAALLVGMVFKAGGQ